MKWERGSVQSGGESGDVDEERKSNTIAAWNIASIKWIAHHDSQYNSFMLVVEKLLNKSGIFTDSIFIELKDKMKGLMIFGIHLLDDILAW